MFDNDSNIEVMPSSAWTGFNNSVKYLKDNLFNISSPFNSIATVANKTINNNSGLATNNIGTVNTNNSNAQKAMEFEAEQARLNREWQEHMSNTSYQRAVADLKARGLNPILAIKGLSGASTPSGSTASAYMENTDSTNTKTNKEEGLNLSQALQILGITITTLGAITGDPIMTAIGTGSTSAGKVFK